MMPRATKNIPSKSTGLKRRFSLRSKKVQFFVIIGIIATIGGGYMVSRSFAATTVRTASVNAGQLVCSSSCTVQTDPGKNNSKVGVLQTGGRLSDAYRLTLPVGWYRTCVVAKGSGTLTIAPYQQLNPNPAVLPVLFSTVSVNDSTTYKKYCSPAFAVSGSSYSASIRISMVNGKLVSVSQAFVEKL